MLLSLLSSKQIPPHIRQDHSQGSCVVEDLVAPPGVEEVGDDAEAPLEDGLAARGGRGDALKARFQEFVRFRILGELERHARSEQAAGDVVVSGQFFCVFDAFGDYGRELDGFQIIEAVEARVIAAARRPVHLKVLRPVHLKVLWR